MHIFFLFFLECVKAYMTISLMQTVIGRVNILAKQGNRKSKTCNRFTHTQKKQTKRREHKHQIKRNHQPQKGKQKGKMKKHRIDWKTKFNMAISTLCINNYLKSQ